MIAPAPDHSASRDSRGNDPAIRRRRRPFRRALLAVTAIAIAYLTLIPNNGHARFRILPLPLYRWFAAPEHDGFVNIAAFGFLATVVFLAGRNPGTRGSGLLVTIFASRTARLAALLALVCGIEILQRWIPGRTSSLQDVCTGWSGIFAAWLLCTVIDHAPRKTGG